MKTVTIIKIIVLGLILISIPGIVYLCISFIIWSTNVATWPIGTRAMLILISICIDLPTAVTLVSGMFEKELKELL
jgi:hypothetical protein